MGIALGGDFTLTYTDAYNQEWTTRPIRVTTVIQETAGASEIAVATATTVTDTQRRFNMFEPYDVIEFEGLAHPTINGKPTTQTITDISCTDIQETACTITVSPGFAAAESAAAGNDIKITLVNSDTGEIGVKRMLQELPGQVVPSITVDETIGRDYNTFKITFSDAANSGDQHALKCRAAACDSDGCQPRKRAIKGLFRYNLVGDADNKIDLAVTASTSRVVDKDSGMSNFRTAAQGGGNVEIVTGSSVLKGGSTSAPAKVDAAYIEWNTANIVVPGKSGTAANLKGGGSAQNAPTDLNSKVITLYQIHDFDADSVGHKTGGIAGDWSNPLGVATHSASDANKIATAQSSTTVAGPHIKTTTDTPFDENGFENFVAGDRIWISCSDGSNTFSGYYKIVSTASDTLALDRSLPTFATQWTNAAECTAKKIVDTVCEVEETVKGTSENAECSNRGNCDSQTGLCTCFAGYTGEDCSVQTVLV